MKSAFFLVFSLLTISPLISFLREVYFSYFICLIFLRGVFVVVVYFSRISKFTYVKYPVFVYISFFFPVVIS